MREAGARLGPMSMREDCRHFETRSYGDDGEVVRFCTLDLAPEAPWRCPENCPKYERSLIDKTFENATLERPEVEDEPEGEGIGELLDEAEDIVNAALPDALDDLDQQPRKMRRGWKFWRKGGDDGPFRLSQR